MIETLHKFNNSSSITTAATATSTSTSIADAVHQIILAARSAGLQLNAATLGLVRSWLAQGITPELVLDYIIPETALAPRPSIRYAAAIANRLIKAGIRTVEQATARPAASAAPTRSRIIQCDYDQRSYTDRKPGELPAWLAEMMEEEERQKMASL